MASVIDTPIAEGSFEVIGRRIGQILADELPSQATLLGDANLDANVWFERFFPVSHVEGPTVNVAVSTGGYSELTRTKQNGTFDYVIQIFETSKSIGNDKGDYLANVKLQKLTNVVRGILKHWKYNTLGFAAGFIETTVVKNISFGSPKGAPESDNMVMSVITFEVRAPEDVPAHVPIELGGWDTKAVLGETDKGLAYGDDFDPPVGPICASGIVNINGPLFGEIESGGTLNLEVRDTLDALVGFNDAGIWRVPAGLALSRVYLRPAPTGQLASLYPFDDGYRVTNDVDPSIQLAQGNLVRLNLKKKWKLLDNNTHGHLFRFVGPTGGYWDPDLALYKDILGATTTRALAFPFNYLEDHFTGLGWIMEDNKSNILWVPAMDEVAGLTSAGFNDWVMPNSNELLSIVNDSYTTPLGNGVFPVANTPFDTTSNSVKWTATQTKALPTRRATVSNLGLKGTQDISIVARYMPCRYALNNT